MCVACWLLCAVGQLYCVHYRVMCGIVVGCCSSQVAVCCCLLMLGIDG